jgi:hypothetical protein
MCRKTKAEKGAERMKSAPCGGPRGGPETVAGDGVVGAVKPSRTDLASPYKWRWRGWSRPGRASVLVAERLGAALAAAGGIIGVSGRVLGAVEVAIVVVVASIAGLAGPAAAGVGDDGEEAGPARSAA